MSAVVIDGGLVHYEAFGRGRPVLFLHGWLGSWRYWMPTMEAIADQHRTYALDLWGFGDSDKSKKRYSIVDYVDLVDNFINNMGIRDTPIIGHALGGIVALEYAFRFPGQTGKVMTVCLPMNADCISRRLIDFANNSMMAKVMWWRQISYKEVQSEAEKTGDGAIHDSVQSVAELDVRSRIEKLSLHDDTMLLAVYGEKDDVIDPTPAYDALNTGWHNIRPITLSDSKHFPMLDEAAKFQRLLKDFLDLENDLTALELKEEWRRRTR